MNINNFPDSSRLWVFGLSRQLADDSALLTKLNGFLATWKAHGAALLADAELLEGQAIVIAADESSTNASGCSIDALTRSLAKFCSEEGVDLLDGSSILYRSAEGWKAVSRAEFKTAINSGEVGLDNQVMDFTLTNVSDFKSKGVIKKIQKSWHAQAFNFNQ